MAVSNSIGSNVFDVLIGLGLPWSLQTLAVKYGSYVSPILYLSDSFFFFFLIHKSFLLVTFHFYCQLKVLSVACERYMQRVAGNCGSFFVI